MCKCNKGTSEELELRKTQFVNPLTESRIVGTIFINQPQLKNN